MAKNPLKQILDIRRDEAPLAVLMFLYFFLVITTFWILKPLKKGLFIGFYDQTGFDLGSIHLTGSQAELIAKVLNMGVALVAVMTFTFLVRSFKRQQLTFIFSGFFVLCFVIYSFLVDAPSSWTVWTFYLFGDLYSTLMVATFFAFLNDSVAPDAAKRLYGLIGLGGVSGGWFGTEALSLKINDLSLSEWLWVCLGIAAIIGLIAFVAGRLVDGRVAGKEVVEIEAVVEGGNPALEGAKLVFRSSYLLSIVAIVGLYEMVSTIMDFQFSATIEHYLDGSAIGVQFVRVYTLTNRVAFFIQLFLTSFIMTRFGVGVALLFLPAAALMGSVGFLIAPVLLVGSALNTCDNGFSYSINQSAKEVLYVPTTRDEKYKAKAFIDMFVQRFAKALAVGLSLLITLVFAGFQSLRWLSLVTVVILVFWIVAVRYVGKHFGELEEKQAA
ncbi:MAG: Npt1/Npt2 family nucleotide transporter [bacterium]|nr:Npt1/Npt2 family nucleotide transporter [bacterium]